MGTMISSPGRTVTWLRSLPVRMLSSLRGAQNGRGARRCSSRVQATGLWSLLLTCAQDVMVSDGHRTKSWDGHR